MAMKSTSLVAITVALLAGCTLNSSQPVTSWGKQGITMLDYRTDAGQCALIGATQGYDENGTKSAGGISGQNAVPPTMGPSGATAANSASTGGGGTLGRAPRSVGSSTYSDAASPDFVNRAVTQQQNQEMAAQRARNDALRFCLASRGYVEFTLTREQRAKLSSLAQGSEARREYLFSLGTDPDVLGKQQVVHK
jgi:hypothetical protein